MSSCVSCILRNYTKPIQKASKNDVLWRNFRFSIYRGISYSRYPLAKFAKTGYGKGYESRVNIEFDEEAKEHIEKNNLKFKHEGTFHLKRVELPEKFVHAVELISSHEDRQNLAKNAEELRNYLWSRHLPIEQDAYRAQVSKIESQIKLEENVLLPFLSEADIIKLENKKTNKVLSRLRKSVYHWEPIRYTRMRAMEYLFGRSAGEYASICRIFNEIAKRDPEFKPTTLCDFGSGLCTVSWAARQYWRSSLVEHLCADISTEMNHLAELILRGGSKNNDHPIPALFFRNHLPESYKIRYDLVVSAFSLMELSSARDRLETIDKLWKKTENYLVIVESGTMAGFTIVQEARDYIIGLGSKSKTPPKCFVFSPCPHKLECPRLAFDSIPCNFEMKYRPVYPFHHNNTSTDRFSYIVIRRGYPDADEKMWPRLVEEPKCRRRHIICRVCTKEGNLSEIVLTRSKNAFTDRVLVKRSKWGDVLPVHIAEKDQKNSDSEYSDSEENENLDLQQQH